MFLGRPHSLWVIVKDITARVVFVIVCCMGSKSRITPLKRGITLLSFPCTGRATFMASSAKDVGLVVNYPHPLLPLVVNPEAEIDRQFAQQFHYPYVGHKNQRSTYSTGAIRNVELRGVKN